MVEGIRLQIQGAHGTNCGPDRWKDTLSQTTMYCMWSTWFNAVTMSCNLSRNASIRLVL